LFAACVSRSNLLALLFCGSRDAIHQASCGSEKTGICVSITIFAFPAARRCISDAGRGIRKGGGICLLQSRNGRGFPPVAAVVFPLIFILPTL